MATFTALPSYPLDNDETPRARTARFGDGYEARQQEDLNPLALIYPLTFANRSQTEADEIIDFLRERGGVEAFDWTPPDEDAGKYVCRSWKRSRVAPGAFTITATFEQVFEP